MRMVDDKLRGIPDFPPKLRTLVEHMIVSHHGELEFGSPKMPLFPEALLLHYIDDMDSKMECMRHLIETDRQLEGNFTSYSSSLERVVLKKDRYLGETIPVAEAASAGPSVPAVAPAQPPRPPVPQQARQAGFVPSKTSSPFGDKLLQALQPAEAKRES